MRRTSGAARYRENPSFVGQSHHVLALSVGQIIADKYRVDRVIGAIVAWGASMPEPGLYDRTSGGGFTIGGTFGGFTIGLGA